MVSIIAPRSSSDMPAAASISACPGPRAGALWPAESLASVPASASATGDCQGESGGSDAAMACQAPAASASLPSCTSALAR